MIESTWRDNIAQVASRSSPGGVVMYEALGSHLTHLGTYFGLDPAASSWRLTIIWVMIPAR